MFQIEDCEPCSLEELLRVNEDDFSDRDIEDLRSLTIGQSLTFGGGAWATFTITRTA